MAESTATTEITSKRSGLGYWAQRVLEECDKVSQNFDADPVHDLRVALRRCRSMADGFIPIDPDPEWKQLKKLGKRLFSQLGELRDVQIMMEWVNRLGNPDDALTQALLRSLSEKERQLKDSSRETLDGFDRKHWESLARRLEKRARKIPIEGIVFQHLAVERWEEAHLLHRRALRNRSQIAFHQLRIGLKRFRYTVENFLPKRHERWGKDLRELQDLLGEVHDLDVLWGVLSSRSDVTSQQRHHWQTRIKEERLKRLARYRQKMVGKETLWPIWRADLPIGKQLERAALVRLRIWASFLDPDAKHSQAVTRLSLQLYQGLVHERVLRATQASKRILEAAALLHDVGRAKSKQGHHKESYRLIRRLEPPLGWTLRELRAVAAVARYHCGALPNARQKSLIQLPSSRRASVIRLAGVLRLANGFDLSHDQKVRKLHVERQNRILVVKAEGYEELGPTSERIAAARYLLETACGTPIVVRSLISNKGPILAVKNSQRGQSATPGCSPRRHRNVSRDAHNFRRFASFWISPHRRDR
jgi:CHAD domain-containing protein/HD superfamily phosphodiesterase